MTEPSDVPFGLEITKGLVAKFLLAGIGFVGTILFARILGPVAFGGFYLVWSLVEVSKLPIDGFSQASNKRFSETDTNRPEILGAAVFVILCAGTMAVVGAVIAQDQIAAFTGLDSGFILFGVLFLATGIFTPFQGMLAATGRVSLTVWVDLLRSLLTTPLQLLFVLLNFGAAGMAYGLSLATLLTIPVTHYMLRIPPSVPSRSTLRRLWSYARHSMLSAILGKAYKRFDILLLGFLLTPAAAGHYEVALKLTLPAVLLSEIAGEGLMARISNLHSKGQSFADDLTNTLSFTSILAVPIFFGGLVLSRPLVVTIYGPDYDAAAPLLVGLAMYRLIRSQTTPLEQTVNGIDRPGVNVRVSAIALALNITLGVAFTLEWGSIGVVVATVLAEGLRYSILFFVVRRWITDVELVPDTLLEQLGAAVAMGLVVLGADSVIQIQSWMDLSILIGLGAAVYGITLLAVSEKLRYTVLAILEDAGYSTRDFV